VVLPFSSRCEEEGERKSESERCKTVKRVMRRQSYILGSWISRAARQSSAPNRSLPRSRCQTGSRSRKAPRPHRWDTGFPACRDPVFPSERREYSSLGGGSFSFSRFALQGRGVFHLRAITILARFPVRIISNVDERSVIPGYGGDGKSRARARGHILPRGRERKRDGRAFSRPV